MQVKNYILEHIRSGEWTVGMQIPTEESLAQMLHVSRPTIRQALSILTNEGYLERTKRKGTFVKKNKLLHRTTSMLASYHTESIETGFKIHTTVLENQPIIAQEIISNKLLLSGKNKKVNILTRLRYLEGFQDNKPVVYTTVYVPYYLFPDMAGVDYSTCSFYDSLDERGLSVCEAFRELEVILPKEDLLEALQISRFEPVICIKSTGITSNGIKIEYAESFYPASSSKFEIHMNKLTNAY